MMKNNAWPTFSFTELLTPPDGWVTDAAILSTYSADLVVIVTALLALTGCDLDSRRTGSRVELIKAIEALRGRVRVLAQTSRLPVPDPPRPILKLLDKFVTTINTDENVSSWHLKAALVRFRSIEEPDDTQWRLWLGSRNLTRASNWEAGMVLASRADGKGRRIEGLANVGLALATYAKLPKLRAVQVRAELRKLTWECPPGSDVTGVDLFGPGLGNGFPSPPADTERVVVISPFLDVPTVRAVSKWGGPKTRRTLVSTETEFQRLFHQDEKVFSGFDLRKQTTPELPGESTDTLNEGAQTAVEVAESEEWLPPGLHAKLYFASKGARRQLWLGSANATERAWQGRNFEVMASLSLGRDVANGLMEFVDDCITYSPVAKPPGTDADEEALEEARKLLSGWFLGQCADQDRLHIRATRPPPVTDPTIKLEIALMGGPWHLWPIHRDGIVLTDFRPQQRSNFLQIRISRGAMMCAWLQLAPCDPPPDEERDRALIAEYLDPRSFLLWIRSLLAEEPANEGGGDWDAEGLSEGISTEGDNSGFDAGFTLTVEEILRSWTRNSSAFITADGKVQAYLQEIEKRAADTAQNRDAALLKEFRRTWDTLASELR